MKSHLYVLLLVFSSICFSQVRVYEETMTLPTYKVPDPDKIPLFFRNEEVQLAERHIYPYPFYNVQTEVKTNIDYKAVVLENEYIKICVTPEMGGRLYYALDKTNNYDMIYNNRVVKPALIGTLGAWTSGGTEWNTPHHHRATSLLPVDYTITEHADGSKTVWVGEYEKRSQTRWLVGMTLEPGKSYVKMEFKTLNVTPFQYPALFFANNAVHTNDDYQFIFPPDVEMMNFHYVTEFTRWPILNQVYQSYDYTHGEDLSWWNAAKQPTSFFVTRSHQDFMGGIDHGKKAGVAMVGDHRIFKGKKLWNWGKNEVQKVWDEKLTDTDGPYAELMMGFYSDNQPDYNFVAPFETKYGTMYMYGIKNLSNMKEVNKDFAVNLELENHKALIQINATSVQKGTQIILKDKGETIFTKTLEISPVKPFQTEIKINKNTAYEDLAITLLSSQGTQMLSWQKQPPLNEPFPETYEDPSTPDSYTNSQDLFFAGLKLEQFGNTNYDYMAYYKAALARDPNNVLANTQIGTVYLKRGAYSKAQKHLEKAVKIVTGNHKKAQDATSLFYLGICYMQQGEIEKALDMLYRATWDYEWTSAGYTLVSRLEALQNDWNKAYDAADRACKANTQNVEALVSKAIILRKQGDYPQALETIKDALTVDPLCLIAMNELRILDTHIKTDQNLAHYMDIAKHFRSEPYNYIETATRYSEMGLYTDASNVLELAASSSLKELNAYPMIYYHLAMYYDLAGKTDKSQDALNKAGNLPLELCFPYGSESIKVLKYAVSQDSRDVSACYLLGNALADYQHENAIKYWKMAAEIKSSESIIYRNIAYIEANHLQDMPNALANIIKAISLDPTEPRYFNEADLYMSYSSMSPEQLAQFLDEYGTLGKDIVDIQIMEIKLSNYYGNYDKALGLLNEINYHIKEGATFNPHVLWFDANLQTGIQYMNNKDHKKAESFFMQAMEFPKNLEAERNSKVGIAYYYLGQNAALANDKKAAKSWYEKMVNYTFNKGWGAGDFPEIEYYKALAQIELGDKSGAEKRFEKLIEDGLQRINKGKDSRHITVTVDEEHSGRIFQLNKELQRKKLHVSSYYMQGLGHLGLGEKDQAISLFTKALETDPLNIDANLILQSIQ